MVYVQTFDDLICIIRALSCFMVYVQTFQDLICIIRALSCLLLLKKLQHQS